jgi:hypothetical protein
MKNINVKSLKDKSPKNLEDYEPGATRAEVFCALKKVALSPKPPSRKRDSQPASTSS